MILNGMLMIFEFVFMVVVIWYQFGFEYVVIVVVMIVVYVWFIIKIFNWCIGIWWEMNVFDIDVNLKVIDSFFNFEIVKYFGNESMEVEWFDWLMVKYEFVVIKIWMLLVWLNFG